MGKRNDFYSRVEEMRTKEIGNSVSGNSSIDRTVGEFSETLKREESSQGTIPAINTSESAVNEEESPVRLKSTIEINLKPRETEKIHKNFFFPKSLCVKISTLAKQKGVSENALVYEILNNAFE